MPIVAVWLAAVATADVLTTGGFSPSWCLHHCLDLSYWVHLLRE